MTSSSAPPPPEERPDPDGRRGTASTASGRGWFRRLAGSRVVRRAHALLTASSRPDRHRPGAREAGGEETELEALFGPDLYTFSGSPQGSPDTSTTFDPAPPPRPIEQAVIDSVPWVEVPVPPDAEEPERYTRSAQVVSPVRMGSTPFGEEPGLLWPSADSEKEVAPPTGTGPTGQAEPDQRPQAAVTTPVPGPEPEPVAPDVQRRRRRARHARPTPEDPLVTLRPTGGGEPVLLRGLTVVGRDPENISPYPDVELLALDDPSRSVSKTHAMLAPTPDGLWVMDLHSTNGTRIGHHGARTRLEPEVITPAPAGSVLHLGRATYYVEP